MISRNVYFVEQFSRQLNYLQISRTGYAAVTVCFEQSDVELGLESATTARAEL